MGKKRKHGRRDAANDMYGAPPYGAGPGYDAGYANRGMPGAEHGYGQGGYGAGAMDAGILQGLPMMLRSRHTEQFLLGAVIGAAAAWVLADEELRAKLVKAGIKLYAGIAGGFEEMKEQVADIKAEVEAERQGGA